MLTDLSCKNIKRKTNTTVFDPFHDCDSLAQFNNQLSKHVLAIHMISTT